MGLFTLNNASTTSLTWGNSIFTCGKSVGLYDVQKILPAKSCRRVIFRPRALASQNSVKKSRRERQASEREADEPSTSTEYIQNEKVDHSDVSAAGKVVNFPSRGTVLQACTVTSGLIAALGVLIRQVSHVASIEGLPVLDCSKEVSFDFEMWHVQLITGLVVLISSSRYLLLKTWPDFAESSEAANQQVLTSLQPLDFMIVAFLPGVSEELLFRGALQPLFGSTLSSALLVALVFGVLHLGSGRKYSFAFWATLVGFVYGYATLATSSLVVPMVSHAVSNLVGGILWHYSSEASGKISDTK